MNHSDIFQKACMLHPSIILICDSVTGNIIEANEIASKTYGYSREELTNLNIHDICDFKDIEDSREIKYVHNQKSNMIRAIHKTKEGTLLDMIVNSFEVKLDENRTIIMNTINPFDNLKNKKKEDMAFEENSKEPFIAVDHLGKVVLVNKLFEDVFGIVDKSYIGCEFHKLLEKINCSQYEDFNRSVKKGRMCSKEISYVNCNNEILYFDIFCIPVFQSEKFFGTVITFRDNTAKAKKELMLHNIAYHDSLTNIHNRAYFLKYSDQIIQVAKEKNMRVGIIFSDLDKLKQVNDKYGHKYGDLALQRVSSILPSILKDEEGCFRMGGDEFVSIITDEKVISSIDNICLKIEEEVCKKNFVDDKDISVGITSGYAIFPEESDNIEELLDLADRRMYARKRAKNISRYE